LDADSSLELSFATGDTSNFKLTFLVRKLGIRDPKVVQAAITDNAKFQDLVSKAHEESQLTAYANEICIRHDIDHILEDLNLNHKDEASLNSVKQILKSE